MIPDALGPPTRSRIEAFDQTADELTDAATRWRARVDMLQRAADDYLKQAKNPAGTEWQGQTATRSFEEAYTDGLAVSRAFGHTNAMADIAGRGGDYLRGARQATLEAITQAEEDDFTVGEDLSVTDKYAWNTPEERAASLEAATAHRNQIVHCAARLQAENQSTGAKLRAGAAELTGMIPQNWAGDDKAVQAMDFREAPAPPAPGDMSTGDVDAIDQANRALLQSMLDEYSQLPDGQVKTDRLADIAGIQDALKVPGSHLIYLAKPDNPADMIPAATAIDDPFNADHVSVTVPGVSGATRQSIATMTKEAAGLQRQAQFIAGRVGESQNISTIAWVGYQPPPVLNSWDTVTDDLAQAGAPKLESFLQNLDTASHNPNHTIALFGHSYGSLVSGIALKDGASSVVDNAVMYGSPGFEATSPAKLGMNDHNFFVMSASDDPIRPVASLAPLHGWGSDPNEIIHGPVERYRFTHLQTDEGWVKLTDNAPPEYKTGSHGHSGYPHEPEQQMTGFNLATILLNRPDLAAKVGPYH